MLHIKLRKISYEINDPAIPEIKRHLEKKEISQMYEDLFHRVVTPEERELIEKAAAKDQRTRGSFLRKAALDRAEKILENEPSRP